MAIRVVEENEQIKTAEDAERFIYFDSGCVVFPTGETRKIEGGWEVTCFSTDGRPRAMEHPNRRLPVSALPDLIAAEVPDEPAGWSPYSNPPKDSGKQ